MGRLAVLVAGLLIAGACSKGGTTPELAPLETTTSTLPLRGDLSATTEVAPAKPQGAAPEAIAASLDAAVTARDFCALERALGSLLPDTEDRRAVTATYRSVAAAVRRARGFVPAQLAEQWTAVETAARRAADAAARSAGDVADPALAAPFRTADFEDAAAAIDIWVDDNCEVPVATTPTTQP